MKSILYLVFCILIVGCGTTASSVKFSSETSADNNASFVFHDERPAGQKISRVDTSTGGESYFYGDDNINPTPPNLVKSIFASELNNELSGKVVTLREFSINVFKPEVYIDEQSLDISAASVPGGVAVKPLAKIFISAIEGMRSEKSVLIQVSGDIDGMSFSESMQETFKGSVSENDVKQTINKILQDVVSQVRVRVASNNQP